MLSTASNFSFEIVEHDYPFLTRTLLSLQIAVPKSIENNFPFIDKCIGFDTVVQGAVEAIDRVLLAASSVQNGIGIIKLGSGSMCLNAVLASGAFSTPAFYGDVVWKRKAFRSFSLEAFLCVQRLCLVKLSSYPRVRCEQWSIGQSTCHECRAGFPVCVMDSSLPLMSV